MACLEFHWQRTPVWIASVAWHLHSNSCVRCRRSNDGFGFPFCRSPSSRREPIEHRPHSTSACPQHVAAVDQAAGGRRWKAGSGDRPGQSECQHRRKLTLNCAAQQNRVDPALPVRWRPVNSRFVTGAAIPRPGNPACRDAPTLPDRLDGTKSGESEKPPTSFSSSWQGGFINPANK
jgi:hypothetical protein